MTANAIPNDVLRFLLSSVPSVPYLEALLLVQQQDGERWTAKALSARLYIPEAQGAALLQQLREAGMVTPCEGDALSGGEMAFEYSPRSEKIRNTVSGLAMAYPKRIVEISRIIHSRGDQKAQQFLDAFILRKGQ